MNEAVKKSYTYLPGLDGMRFLAFLLILANHTDLLKRVNGHSFFFLLTGFLLAYITIGEVNHKGGFNLKRYLLRRYIRTLPIFYLAALAAIGTALFFEHVLHDRLTTGKLWPYLLLIHNYFPQDILFPLANLWAMGVTEQFYLVLGLFFLAFPHFNYRHAVLFTLAGLLIFCYSLFALERFHRPYSIYYICNFGMGLLLALFSTRDTPFLKSIINHSRGKVVLCYALSLLLLCFGFHMNEYPWLPFMEIILCLGYAYIIINISFGKFKLIPLDRMPVLQKLGKQTFSMYCFHSFVVTGMQKTFSYFHIDASPLVQFLVAIPPTIAVAQLTYKYIERPIIAFKDRFSA